MEPEFAAAFAECSRPGERFTHRDHVRLAWLLVSRHGFERAGDLASGGLRHVAAAHGEPGRYHETMTRFWVRLVGHAIAALPRAQTFDDLLETLPLLLDKTAPWRHWQEPTLERGRATWVEPDLLPVP